MRPHHKRYLTSFLIVAIMPTIVLLSLLALKKLLIILCIIPVVLCFAIPWDAASTRRSKTKRSWIWEFNPDSVLGIYLFGLPIEEFIFVMVMVSGSIAAWEFFQKFQLSDLALALVAGLAAVFAMIVYPILEKPNIKKNK